MKQHADREVNKEADSLALRLKLSPEQKESVRKFLLDGIERERKSIRDAIKNGGQIGTAKAEQRKEEFLKGLLTQERQADYTKSQEEQRTGRAEEYAPGYPGTFAAP